MLDPYGFETYIHHDKTQLDRMDEWCTKQHASSGLTQKAIASKTTAEEAAASLLEYIESFVPASGVALLAGNTVHADKAFLRKSPYTQVTRFLHHRIFDVSSLKEAAKRWAPEEVLKNSPPKKGLHDARADILESIAEAKFYKNVFFVGPVITSVQTGREKNESHFSIGDVSPAAPKQGQAAVPGAKRQGTGRNMQSSLDSSIPKERGINIQGDGMGNRRLKPGETPWWDFENAR